MSGAALVRALMEAMGNIAWLHEVSDDAYEMKKRMPRLEDGGAGSISNRLDIRGEGWRRWYAHLTSYAHVDTGAFLSTWSEVEEERHVYFI